jgi:hypothetical protein
VLTEGLNILTVELTNGVEDVVDFGLLSVELVPNLIAFCADNEFVAPIDVV